MKTRMVEEREGEDMGPVDWEHPWAKDMPAIWREAEKDPEAFEFHTNGSWRSSTLFKLCMYDGWPYWKPNPAICFLGPLGVEWNWFTSYGVYPGSIRRRAADCASNPTETDTKGRER